MDEEAAGLQGFVGGLASLGMVALFVVVFPTVLRSIAPGVAGWIDHHSLNNRQIWLLELLFAALAPFLVFALVAETAHRLANRRRALGLGPRR